MARLAAEKSDGPPALMKSEAPPETTTLPSDVYPGSAAGLVAYSVPWLTVVMPV